MRGARHSGTCSSQGGERVPELGHLDLAEGLKSGAPLAPGPGAASSALQTQAEASLEVPELLCRPAAAPYRSVLAGLAPGAHGAGSGPGVTWSRGWAPPQPGGRRVAPAAARGPGPAAARAPPAAAPPLAPRSGTVRGPHHPRLRRLRSFTPRSRAPAELPGLHQGEGGGGGFKDLNPLRLLHRPRATPLGFRRQRARKGKAPGVWRPSGALLPA